MPNANGSFSINFNGATLSGNTGDGSLATCFKALTGQGSGAFAVRQIVEGQAADVVWGASPQAGVVYVVTPLSVKGADGDVLTVNYNGQTYTALCGSRTVREVLSGLDIREDGNAFRLLMGGNMSTPDLGSDASDYAGGTIVVTPLSVKGA